MIRAEELRLGNYIDHKELGIVKVISISSKVGDYESVFVECLKDGLDYDFNLDADLTVIPLFEDRLLKAGFKMIDQDGFETSNRYQDLRFSLPIKGKFSRDKMFIRFTLSIGNPPLCSLNIFGQETGVFLDIKSLHQLQNLYFALTGTELQIT